MAPRSNPRLMTRVLDAVAHLCEGRGSSARDVLDFIRQTSKTPARNLTMQVHRALKHAVNAGLLHHRSGRYKALFTLNPAPVKQPINENNDQKAVEEIPASGEEQSEKKNPVRRVQNTEKGGKQRRNQKRRRSRSRDRRRRRRSRTPRKRDGPTECIEAVHQKPKYRGKGEKDRSSRHRISESKMRADTGNASSSKTNPRKSKVKSKERTYYSDLSDSSDYDRRASSPKRKHSHQARRKTPVRQERKHHEINGKSSRRSSSRNRSPQRQQQNQNHQEPQQQLQLQLKHSLEDVADNRMESDDHNITQDQEIDQNREPNNSGSGSTL